MNAETMQTQVRLPKKLWLEIKAKADADRRSANSMLRLLLEDALRPNRRAVRK